MPDSPQSWRAVKVSFFLSVCLRGSTVLSGNDEARISAMENVGDTAAWPERNNVFSARDELSTVRHKRWVTFGC